MLRAPSTTTDGADNHDGDDDADDDDNDDGCERERTWTIDEMEKKETQIGIISNAKSIEIVFFFVRNHLIFSMISTVAGKSSFF